MGNITGIAGYGGLSLAIAPMLALGLATFQAERLWPQDPSQLRSHFALETGIAVAFQVLALVRRKRTDHAAAVLLPAVLLLGFAVSSVTWRCTIAGKAASAALPCMPALPSISSLYAQHRQLDIASAPDGLARIALTAADVAALRPDLGDLRVVDAAGQQWPYLLEHAQRFEIVTLQIGAVSGVKRSRRSLGLPTALLAPSVLLLEPQASFFDRAYRIEGLAEEGDRVQLASGRPEV